MYNKILVCPFCQSHLQRVRKPRNIYWACPRCGGRSSTISLLRLTLPAPIVNRLWQDVRHGNPPRSRPCPSCDQKMSQLSFPGQSLVIDVCPTCTLIWFDPLEYESLPKARAEQKPKERPLPPEAQQRLAMERIKERRRRVHLDKKSPDGIWKYLPALLGMPVEFDDQRTSTVPIATWSIAVAIILINIIAFFDHGAVVQSLGLVPTEWTRMGGGTFLTSFFLHGGLFHLASNMYFLLVFGDNVEDNLGSAQFVLLLLLATFAGGIAYVLLNPSSTTPCIGASGGISALLTYYALQLPRARIGFLFFFRWIRVPVLGYIVFWVALQIAGTQMVDSQVAHGAHLGGAAAGLGFWLIHKYVVKSGF